MPIKPSLAWQLADKVGHAYAVVLEVAQNELAHSEITVAELTALAILQGFPEGLTQTEWGRFQGVTRQRAHSVSKRLKSAGQIALRKQGRTSIVTLTDAGAALIATHQPSITAALSTQMGTLSQAEAEQLNHLLDKLLAHENRGPTQTNRLRKST